MLEYISTAVKTANLKVSGNVGFYQLARYTIDCIRLVSEPKNDCSNGRGGWVTADVWVGQDVYFASNLVAIGEKPTIWKGLEIQSQLLAFKLLQETAKVRMPY